MIQIKDSIKINIFLLMLAHGAHILSEKYFRIFHSQRNRKEVKSVQYRLTFQFFLFNFSFLSSSLHLLLKILNFSDQSHITEPSGSYFKRILILN